MTDNIDLAAYPDGGETPESINEVLRRRVERAEHEEIRLSGLLANVRHELAILERAVETTQQLSHERFESNALLERKTKCCARTSTDWSVS